MIIKKSTKKNSSNEILHILETKHKNTQYTTKKHLHNKNPIFLKKKKKDDKKITDYNQKGSGLSGFLGFWFSGIIMKSEVRANTYGKMSKSIIIKLFLLNKIKQVSDAEYKTYCAHYKGCYYFHKMRSIGIQMHNQFFKLFKGDKSIIQIIHRLIDNIFIKQNEIENAFNSSNGKEISQNVKNIKKIIEEQDKLRVQLMKYTAFTNTKDLTGCIGSKIKKIVTFGISSNYKLAICSLIKYRNIEAEFNKYYNKFITQFRIYLAYFPYCTDELKNLDILSLDLTEKKREKPFDASKCNIDANNQKINMLLEKTLDLHADLLPEKYKEKKFDIPNQKRTKIINESKNFGELHKKFTTYLEAMNNFFAQAETIGIHRFWSLLPRDKRFLEYFSNRKSEEYKQIELNAISKDPQFKKHFTTLMQNINRDASIILEPKDIKIGNIIPIIYIDCIPQIAGDATIQSDFKVLSVNICGNDKMPGNKISVYCANDTQISVIDAELPDIICIQQGTSDMIKKNGEFATNFLEDKYFAACFSVYQQNKYMIVFVKKNIIFKKLLNLETYEIINQTPYFILSDLPKELPKLTNEKAFNVVNIVFVTGEVVPPPGVPPPGVPPPPQTTLNTGYTYLITNIVNLELVGNGAYDLFNVKSINAYTKLINPSQPATTGLRSVQIASIQKICTQYINKNPDGTPNPDSTLIYCGDFGGIFENPTALNALLDAQITALLDEPKYKHFGYTDVILREFYTNGLNNAFIQNYTSIDLQRPNNFVTDNIIYSNYIQNTASGNAPNTTLYIKQSITHSCNKFVIHMPVYIIFDLTNYTNFTTTLGIEYMRERIKGKIGDTGKPNNPTNFISLYTPDELRNIIKVMDKILSFFPYGKKPFIKRELGCLTDADDDYGIRKYEQLDDSTAFLSDVKRKLKGKLGMDLQNLDIQLADIQKFYTLGFPAFIETYLYKLANTYYTGESTKNKAIYYSENQISMLDVITKSDIKNNLPPILKNFSLDKIDVPLRLLLIPTKDLKQIAQIDYIDPSPTIENPNDNPTDYDELSKKFILNFYRDTARPQLENYLNTMMNEIREKTSNNINFIGFLQELNPTDGSLLNIKDYKNIQYLCKFIFISLRLKFMDVQIQNYEQYLDKKEKPLVGKQLKAMERQKHIELYDKTFKLLQSNIINAAIIDIVSGDVRGYPIYEDDTTFTAKLDEFRASTTFTSTTPVITVSGIYNEFDTIDEKETILHNPKLDKSGVGTIDDMRYLEVYLYSKLNLATKHITKLLNEMHDSKDYNDYFSSLMKYTDIETIFNNIDKTITYKKEVQTDTDTFIYNNIKSNLLPAYKQVQEYYCEYFKSFIKIYYKYFYSAYKQVIKKNTGALITNTDKQTALDKINKYITKIAKFYESIVHVDGKLTNNIKQIIESIKNIKKYIEKDDSLEIKILPYITSYNSKYIEDAKSINNNQFTYTGYNANYDNGTNDNGTDDNNSNNAMIIAGGSIHSKKLKKSKYKQLKDVDAAGVIAGAVDDPDDPDDFADDDGDDYRICTNAAIEYFMYIGTLAKADITDTTLLNKIQVLAKYLIMCIKKIGTKNHICLNILKVVNTMNCNLYVILIKATHNNVLINFRNYFNLINALFKDIYKNAENEFKYLTYLLGNALMFYIATVTYYINYYTNNRDNDTADTIFNYQAKNLIISLNDLMFMNNFIKYGTSNDVLKNIIKQNKSEYCGLYKNLLKLEKYNIDAQDEINNAQSTNMLTELKTNSKEIMHNLYQLSNTSTNLVELEKNINSIETHTGTIGIISNKPLINYNPREAQFIQYIEQLYPLTINIVLEKDVLDILPPQFKKTAIPFKNFALTSVNVDQNNKCAFTENSRIPPQLFIWKPYNDFKNTYCDNVNKYIYNEYERQYTNLHPRNHFNNQFNSNTNTFINLNFYDYDLKFNHIQTITSCKNFLDTLVPNNKVILTINKIWNDMQNEAILERLANLPINNVHNIIFPPQYLLFQPPNNNNNLYNNLYNYIIKHLYVNVYNLYMCINNIRININTVQQNLNVTFGYFDNEINGIDATLNLFYIILNRYIVSNDTLYTKLCSIVFDLLRDVNTNIFDILFTDAHIQNAHTIYNTNYTTFFKIITMLYTYFNKLQIFILQKNTLLIYRLITYIANLNNQPIPDFFNLNKFIDNIYYNVVINEIQTWYANLNNQQIQLHNILQTSILYNNNCSTYLNIEKIVNKTIFITFTDNQKIQILYNTIYALLMLYLQCKDNNEENEIKDVAKYLCIQSYTTYIPRYKFDNKIYNAKYYATILNTTQFNVDIPKTIMLNTYTDYSKYAKNNLETIVNLLYVSMANFVSFKSFNNIFTSLNENRNNTVDCINFINDLEYTEPTGTSLTNLKTKYTNLHKYYYCSNALNYINSLGQDTNMIKSYIDSMDLINYINELNQIVDPTNYTPINTQQTDAQLVQNVLSVLTLVIRQFYTANIQNTRYINNQDIYILLGKAEKYTHILNTNRYTYLHLLIFNIDYICYDILINYININFETCLEIIKKCINTFKYNIKTLFYLYEQKKLTQNDINNLNKANIVSLYSIDNNNNNIINKSWNIFYFINKIINNSTDSIFYNNWQLNFDNEVQNFPTMYKTITCKDRDNIPNAHYNWLVYSFEIMNKMHCELIKYQTDTNLIIPLLFNTINSDSTKFKSIGKLIATSNTLFTVVSNTNISEAKLSADKIQTFNTDIQTIKREVALTNFYDNAIIANIIANTDKVFEAIGKFYNIKNLESLINKIIELAQNVVETKAKQSVKELINKDCSTFYKDLKNKYIEFYDYIKKTVTYINNITTGSALPAGAPNTIDQNDLSKLYTHFVNVNNFHKFAVYYLVQLYKLWTNLLILNNVKDINYNKITELYEQVKPHIFDNGTASDIQQELNDELIKLILIFEKDKNMLEMPTDDDVHNIKTNNSAIELLYMNTILNNQVYNYIRGSTITPANYLYLYFSYYKFDTDGITSNNNFSIDRVPTPGVPTPSKILNIDPNLLIYNIDLINNPEQVLDIGTLFDDYYQNILQYTTRGNTPLMGGSKFLYKKQHLKKQKSTLKIKQLFKRSTKQLPKQLQVKLLKQSPKLNIATHEQYKINKKTKKHR